MSNIDTCFICKAIHWPFLGDKTTAEKMLSRHFTSIIVCYVTNTDGSFTIFYNPDGPMNFPASLHVLELKPEIRVIRF